MKLKCLNTSVQGVVGVGYSVDCECSHDDDEHSVGQPGAMATTGLGG